MLVAEARLHFLEISDPGFPVVGQMVERMMELRAIAACHQINDR